MKVFASERIEPLVAQLARVLVEDPLPPMTPEWIAVGSDGLQRWLQLELSRHLGAQTGRADGVAANIRFHYPGALRTTALLAGTEREEYDPWLVGRLTWSVLETLQSHPNDPVLSPLVDSSTRSIYRRARYIADRFALYQLHRPEMLRAWKDGNDIDAIGGRLPSAHAWQPHLWRLVRAHAGFPSPAERLPIALDGIRNGSLPLSSAGLELPPRLIFFGPSLLPSGAGFLEVADAVAVHRDVLVYVIEPSAALSGSLRASASELTARFSRSHDVSAQIAVHPLLRSWGRLQRETALLLADLPVEVVACGERPADSLLHALQSDLRSNRAPAGAFQPSQNDASIRVHRCYGPTRQLEVMRDSLLDLLNDPHLDLTEDDIVVACPALDTFAPLIGAVLGPSATSTDRSAADGSPLLRYRLADSSTPPDNPVIEALTSAMRLAVGRFEITDVIDFVSSTAVRSRFHWTEDDLERISGWLEDTNVRWGLDGPHRENFDLSGSVSEFTWRNALDQLLLGTAIDSGDSFSVGGVFPVRFAADDPTLLGQLAGVIDSLGQLTNDSYSNRSVEEWSHVLERFVLRVLAAAPDEQWQMDSLHRLLTRVVNTSRLARPTPSSADPTAVPPASPAILSFREMTELIDDTLASHRGRSDFFRGGITITSLNALRNVPAKVICVLGADQAAFSAGSVDSDDLIGAAPRLGDRDRRAEVRQTLLDSLLGALDVFMVFSDGFNVRTNVEIPHAVVVSELLDAIESTCADAAAVSALVTTHPRHAFASSYFGDGGSPGVTQRQHDEEESKMARSFNLGALAAARARQERVAEDTAPPWVDVVMGNPPGLRDDHITLGDLREALTKPSELFLRGGLGIRLPRGTEVPSAELPIETDSLAAWNLGNQLMNLSLRGRDTGRWKSREVSLGNLPPLHLADQTVASLEDDAHQISLLTQQEGLDPDGERIAIDIRLNDGRRLTGQVRSTLTGDRRGTSLVSFSRVKPEQQLSIWIELLALTALDDSQPWHGIIVNRGSSGEGAEATEPVVTRFHTGEIDSSEARETLTQLARIHDTAVRQPVPFFPRLSRALNVGDAKSTDWKPFNREHPPEVLYIYGDLNLFEMQGLIAKEGHQLIEPGAPLLEAYADLVWGFFDRTVTFDTPSFESLSEDEYV